MPLAYEIESFLADAEHRLCEPLTASRLRFRSCDRLLDRYRACVALLRERGVDAQAQYQTAHNELCIALELLRDRGHGSGVSELEYELPSVLTAKRIDFQGTLRSGQRVAVEVKSIRPAEQDDWQKFLRDQDEGRIANCVDLAIDREFGGGEIYHAMRASRSTMLEDALEFEAAIAATWPDGNRPLCVLAICGTPLGCRKDWVEDFADFYRHGRHRTDDPFAEMERHHLQVKTVSLARTIDHFAYLRRSWGVVDADQFVASAAGPAELPGGSASMFMARVS
jgi:hypothetical protein